MDWAQAAGVISRNFLYFPMVENDNSSLENHGNAGTASFAITDTTTVNPLTSAPGYWRNTGAATTYASVYDDEDTKDAIMSFLNQAEDGYGGGGLIIAFKYKAPAAFSSTGVILHVGDTSNGMRIAVSTGGILQARFYPGGNLDLLGSAFAVNEEYKVLIYLDANNGNVLVYVEGSGFTTGSQTLGTALATILADLDRNLYSAGADKVVVGGNQTATVTGPPTVTVGFIGQLRDLLLLSADSMTTAEVGKLFTEYRQGANYALPRYIGDV